MADSLATSVQAMDLDAPDVDNLIGRCKTLHEEVEQYVSAVSNPPYAKSTFHPKRERIFISWNETIANFLTLSY